MDSDTLAVGFRFVFWVWSDDEACAGTLETRLGSLMLEDGLSDFALISSDGKRFPCSKVLLAGRSDVFKALLKHDRDKKELVLEECGGKVLGAIVSWIYSGNHDQRHIFMRYDNVMYML